MLLRLACWTLGVEAQPRYDFSRLQRERLDRGVVAFKKDGKVIIQWRTLRSDAVGEPFEVLRNGSLLTTVPLTSGGNFYSDEIIESDALYEVRGGGINGQFLLKADAPDGYLRVPIERPASQMNERGREISFSANDASVGDVDGDGQYEIFLKWQPRNAADNSHTGFTGNTFIDCYKLDGRRLWRIDMGPNIRSGAHYTQFIVYDFDGDGRAEMMVKTADGTIDGMGNVIGDASKDWRSTLSDNTYGRIMDGPEFLTVFDGLSGKALSTVPYVPERGEPGSWGDNYANRSERYLAGVGYLDGIHPSAIFCRGYYTRTVIVAWNWDGRQLRQHWVFDTNSPQWSAYAGQGNHNLRVADVDGDGCDEITYGAMCVDHNGKGLYNTGMGHGDALHLTAFDPTTDRLQVWDCHENKRDGSDFRDAATGRVIFQVPSSIDVGRCMAADIDPTNVGVEMWSSDSKGIRNIKGEVVGDARWISTNFGVWWDGDLLRELLDREMVTKYNWTTGRADVLKRFDGRFNNGTKSNPCLSADVLGDWREEVIVRNEESTELRIFITDIPTPYRINCLMEDIPYRLSVAAENVAYNQPPETGFYLGPDTTVVPFLK